MYRRRLGLLLASAAILCAQSPRDTLTELPRLASPTGSEENLTAYLAKRIGGQRDSTGSLSITFDAAGPHTLIVAGLDEPTLAVSAIEPNGYLRVQPLADPEPSFRFAAQWQGLPVRIGLPPAAREGVFVAPSVHLQESRYGASASSFDGLYLDIGARSAEEATAAGIGILDPVTVGHTPAPSADHTWGGPWLSARSGWITLLHAAEALRAAPPTRRITLGFATQQWRYNRGLERLLAIHQPDRLLVLAPGGEPGLTLGAAQGYTSPLVDELERQAETLDIPVRRSSSAADVSFGPFAPPGDGPLPESGAVLQIGAQHATSPYERVSLDDIETATRFIVAFAGGDTGEVRPFESTPAADADQPPPPTREPMKTLHHLLGATGLSGHEKPVRDRIARTLHGKLASRMSVDAAGNLIYKLGESPDAEPTALFIAHMDEIGFSTTTAATSGGTNVEAVGGLIAGFYEHWPMEHTIFLGNNRVAGSLQPGTPIVPRRHLIKLLNNRWAARGFDDRVGCAVLVRALQTLHKSKQATRGNAVWIVFSVEEETGLHGARALANRVAPHRVYPIDSFVSSDSPIENQRYARAELGQGFVLRAVDQSGMTPRAEVERVTQIAERENIPMQIGLGNGGNDGSVFVPKGSINVPLAWPLRNAHTAVETLDEKDVVALEAITLALIRDELRAKPN